MKSFFVCVLMLMCSTVFAQTTNPDIETLRGIKGFVVIVEEISPVIEKQGLSRTALQNIVESEFQTSGITVLTKEEGLKEPGNPYVYLQIASSSDYEYCAFTVNFELHQNVTLTRNAAIETIGACTLRKSRTRFSSVNFAPFYIKGSASELARQFIEDYYSVNPRPEL